MKVILRILLAIIFIASGFVKAVDVVGFSFKLEEYFSPSVFNLPYFEKYALYFAVVFVLLELVLGFCLLLKIKVRQILIALIALCIFFAFLTFYSAYYNKVTDCGCFGDALKFTPWQSFTKDMVLLVGLLVLYRMEKKNNAIHSTPTLSKLIFGILSLVMLYCIYHGIAHEPIIDFRNYTIGTNIIAEKEKILKNPSEYKTAYTLKNKKTSEEKLVDQDEYVNNKAFWEEGSPWEIVPGKDISKLVKEGYTSEIGKFRLENSNGEDITTEVLQEPKVILLFSYNVDDIDTNAAFKKNIQLLSDNVKSQKYAFFEVSNSSKRLSMGTKLEMDATAIKTIARSNPFILILEKGIIVEKKSLKDYINP